MAGKIPPTFSVRQRHPRLLITPENKQDVREKIKAAPAMWRRVIEEAEHGSGEELVLACGAIYQLGLVDGAAWNPRLNNLVATATGYLKQTDPKGAALARWWVDRFRGYEESGLVNGLLIGDPRAKARSPAELDLDGTLVMRGPNNVYMRSHWADPDAVLSALVSTYQKDRDETLELLKGMEQFNTTRFASLAQRFCVEQRRLFAGGQDVDWVLIREVVMDKLPRYTSPNKMAGVVASITAVLEGNEADRSVSPAAYPTRRRRPAAKRPCPLCRPATPWERPSRRSA